MPKSTNEKHTFQAEVQQLLDIVIHSLYTDKEIFIRELISNASDALEKMRHINLQEKEVFDDRLDLEINITTDDKANTITIQDFGVGMTREELKENLGTIAHSGSKAFLNAVKESGAESGTDLIGQFGVGFYSAFMVAKRVSVYTHSWQNDGEHLLWTCDGSGDYEIETIEGQRRGSKIVVFLKDEDKEFGTTGKVKEIIQRYSNYVQFPINLNGDRVNTIQAIWLRNKSEITDEEYTEFYKYQANAFDEPQYRLHFAADAPLSINALLFVPKDNPEKWGFGRIDPGVGLHCRKILIDSKPDGLFPEWLRFLKGVVDSADLPLNISRESMQDSALVKKLNTVLTRRFLKFLENEAKKKAEDYDKFYQNFGHYLKEGITTDPGNRDRIAKLLRFETSITESGKTASLDDYVSRMKEDQKEIYYLYAPNRTAIDSGPYLEAFKARNLEVLYLFEPIDEFVMSHLHEFDHKSLVSADQADLNLDDVSGDSEGEALEEKVVEDICSWLKSTLGERVKSVTASKRLVDSPAIALNPDKFMTPSMRRLMRSMQQDMPEAKSEVNLEINPRHNLVKNLAGLKDTDAGLAEMVAEQILDNALVAAGFMEDPRDMINRVYSILEKVTEKK